MKSIKLHSKHMVEMSSRPDHRKMACASVKTTVLWKDTGVQRCAEEVPHPVSARKTGRGGLGTWRYPGVLRGVLRVARDAEKGKKVARDGKKSPQRGKQGREAAIALPNARFYRIVRSMSDFCFVEWYPKSAHFRFFLLGPWGPQCSFV